MSSSASSTLFGVQYTPQTAQQSPILDPTTLFDRYNIRYIRLQWLDFTNTLRQRIIPRSYFEKVLSSNRPGVGIASGALGLVFLSISPGFSSSGECLLVPDLSSLRYCPYAPGHASLMGFLQEKTPTPEHGLSVPICPRTLLKRIVDDAAHQAGISFLIGFETEFILLKETSPKPVVVNDADWAASRKTPSGKVETIVLEEIADAVQGAGVELQMVHAEGAPGQYEVVTGPLPPLESADALVVVRETIYNVASKHGLRATLAPRIHMDSAGSAAHTHISVHPLNTKSTGDLSTKLAPTLSSHSRSFLQALLECLPSLCALTLPTKFSYARMFDGIWSGGTWVGWGIDAREAPIRVTGSNAAPSLPGGQGGGQHFEIRCIDGTANPYLALAGILGVGTKGVSENAKLTVNGVDVSDGAKTIAEMDQREREEAGVWSSQLPQTLPLARKRLEDDKKVRDILGDDFLKKYLSVNETMEKMFRADSEEATTTKLVEYY